MNLSHPSARMIVSYCQAKGVPLTQAAYCLATAWHETARFRYMREIWGPTPAQKRYEGRADLGNTQPGDGRRFLGRGFVQITGRRNYADWSKRLGIDIVSTPEFAEKPEIAVRILVEGMLLGTFTGKALPAYVNDNRTDYVNARRVVNGTDRAKMIAGYAVEFERLLEQAKYKPADAHKPASPSVPLPTPEPAPAARYGWLSAILQFVLRLFRKDK